MKGQAVELGGAPVTPTDEDIDAAMDMLEAWLAGTSQTLYLPASVDLAMQQGAVSTADATENYGNFKEIAREALGSTLKNLGVGGSGSLALGQEVSDVDESALTNAVDSYLDLINGTRHENSNLIDLLTATVTLTTSESNYVGALYDTLISRVRLSLALGRPVPGEQPIEEVGT